MSFINVDWQEFALCRQVDPDLFHPTKGGPEIKPARSICDGCEVRLQCLNYAIRRRITGGIWGGFSGKQLTALVRFGIELDAVPEYSDKRRFNGPKKAIEKSSLG